MLIVDDERPVRVAFERIISRLGYEVVVAEDGPSALEAISQQRFDTIVSDIMMPGLTGVELLEAIRRDDPDVPVIFVTGSPNLDTAVRAIEFGVYRYLTKPVAADELLQTVQRACQLSRLAALKRDAVRMVTQGPHTDDIDKLHDLFTDVLDELYMAYQPIVDPSTREVFSYEALMRSKNGSLGHPGLIIDAAERLERLDEIALKVSSRVKQDIDQLHPERLVFVNLHPNDLKDGTLSLSGLEADASRVVLEITERIPLEGVEGAEDCIKQLRGEGFKLALDDMGAGYAGLNSFIRLSPEFVKLDMALIRNVDTDIPKQNLVRSISELCRNMGMRVISEGVETAAEARTLVALGADLLQGFYFALPEPSFLLPDPALYEPLT